ncbi:MAG: proline dehydrogenase family protein, partial [Terriglobia bacterium]
DYAGSNLAGIVERAAELGNFVWIDMEASDYTDSTLRLFRGIRENHANVGVCLQAYLRRTTRDLEELLPLGPAIRVVKGAYKESPSLAFRGRKEVDENYLRLARTLFEEASNGNGTPPALGTHDLRLIGRLEEVAAGAGLKKEALNIQMLYGIQRAAQLRLAAQGYPMRVLISYGDAWFPWYMRRLAERPANILFVLRNLFAR